jgi:mRNA interferase MazF
MLRGDVYWVDLDPTRGGEIQKSHPCVIVSNDIANRLLNRVQIVPLTSRVDPVYPSEAVVVVDGTVHKAMADQIRTVSKARIGRFVASLSPADIEAVESVIRVQLGL